MPSKKKKYNARFPAGRIKKIMQTDEEVGKVAQAVPVIISRTLELFVESLLTKTLKITNARNAKTLSPSHMKQCIISESRFDFLRDLVKNIPDMGINEELSGSEAGYGNDGASPASTSTSSSSNGGGGVGGGAANVLPYEPQQQSHNHHRLGGGAATNTLHRSESYTPATASSANVAHREPATKRGLSQSGILNFYKEIPLEEEEPDSGPPAPPPKLTRLNSAPAATAIPYKIDILATAGAVGSDADKQQGAKPIGYQIEPVIKLDYSNLVSLNSAASGTVETSSNVVPTGSTKAASAPQPTVKIDLSRLPMATVTTTTTVAASTQGTTNPIATPKQQHPVPSTIVTRTSERRERQPPSTGGSNSSSSSSSSSSHQQTASGSSASSSSSSSPQSAPTTPVIGQSPVPTAPPIFAALSTAIPGMDEDYDDI
ncbi:flocculation protein FLO11-like [Anopheles albimanus]|uniref:Transcription factor CBF/NF-Y/archaeal histone domain-containing protein n=1 Tax=Anopheles albimanus TaxID=7167 RepID=A0A8W7K265_ANOAL|nr:flocculation protein FLO11-like [Anopheles albimanus]